MNICYYNKMKNENETGELNMLKVLNIEEVSEYVVNSEVFEVSGVYKVMLNDDCEVVSCEIVEESEVMNKDVKYYVNGEFCIDDEDYEYYKVEVEIDEEDVFENGVLVIEDVSKDDFDDSGVLVYSYKGKYILMSFDFGGSLCNVEEYNSLNEVKI